MALQDNQVYSVDGKNYLASGNHLAPIYGDASQYGTPQALPMSVQDLMRSGGGLLPDEYAVFNNGLKAVQVANPGGGSFQKYQDAQGNLFDDPNGTVKGVNPTGGAISSSPTYAQALNDSTTPRVNFQYANGSAIDGSGTLQTGADALAAQAANRTTWLKGQVGGPQSTYMTSEDAAKQLAALHGVQIASTGAPANAAATRNLISQTPQANYIKAYDTNNDYKQVYVPAGKYVQGVSLYPKNSSSITADSSLKQASATQLPGAGNAGTDASGALVAGANASIAELIKQLTPAQTETEKKQQTLLDQMTSLVGQEANKAADQLTQEQSAGLPGLRKQFADINAQILTKTAEYNALQTTNQNKTITMDSIIGNDRAILNAKASDIGLLNAQALGLQGQITTAQDTVNRSIDLKYSSIESQLKVYEAQLNAIQPTLTKEQKTAAEAQQIWVDNQRQALADKKATEKGQAGVILDLISKYPDAKIAFTDSLAQAQAKLKNSKIYQEATRFVGSSTTDLPVVPPAIARTDIGKVTDNKNGTYTYVNNDGTTHTGKFGDNYVDKTSKSTTPNTSQSVLAWAGISSPVFNYLTQGTTSLTRMSADDRKKIMAEADGFLNKNGLDFSTFQSKYKAYNEVLQKNLERANQTQIMAGEVAGSADALIAVIDEKNLGTKSTGIWPFNGTVGKWKASNLLDISIGKQVNDPLTQAYATQLSLMTNDFAGYLAASRGASSPELQDKRDAAEVIANGLNSGSVQAFKDAIMANEHKVTGVVNKAVESANKNVWSLFGVQDKYDVSHNGVVLPQDSPSGSSYQGVDLPH